MPVQNIQKDKTERKNIFEKSPRKVFPSTEHIERQKIGGENGKQKIKCYESDFRFQEDQDEKRSGQE